MPRIKHKHVWLISPVYDFWNDGSRLEAIRTCTECGTLLVRRYKPRPGWLRIWPPRKVAA